MKLPDIVGRFRAFVEIAATDGPVVIGIDELDKMGSDFQARQFLNEIKAVFGIDKCFYLISVSEDAVASFERRGLPFRDVFDSSLDDTLHVQYLDLAAAENLLSRRVIGLTFAAVALSFCVSGGLARDLIRTTRTLVELRESLERADISSLSRALAVAEFLSKRDATLVAMGGLRYGPQVSEALPWLGSLDERHLSLDSLVAVGLPALERAAAWIDVSRPGGDLSDAAPDRIGLWRLVYEFLTYFYFCVTLIDTFAKVTPTRLEEAEVPESGLGALNQLARARQELSVDPGLAWRRLSAFREDWGLVGADIPKTFAVEPTPLQRLGLASLTEPADP